MLLRNLQIRCGLCYGFGCCIPTREQYEFALHGTLLNFPNSELGISESLHKSLLLSADEDYQTHVGGGTQQQQPDFLCYGMPCAPFYKELAKRMYALLEIQEEISQKKNDLLVVTNKKQKLFAIPAASLGLEELEPPTFDSLPPVAKPPTIRNTRNWLRRAGDQGVLRIMGLRKTVGTCPNSLLPPPQSALLAAAAAPHKKGHGKLSVAARARAKHAHRGQEQFFGLVKGSPEKQSEESQSIVINILDNAVWSNIHVFGGIVQPVLEVRLENGYGCRWTADWTDAAEPTSVEFRGFLEPQMADGHEKGWKH